MDENRRDSEDGKPVWQASDQERQVDADAYHIWTPRPLIRSVYWRPDPEPPREAVAGSYEVFLDQRVFATMHEHVWNATVGRSQFGYLIGDLCEDPSANRRFVIVTAAAPSRFPFFEAGPEQIPAEASAALQLEVERRRGVLVGWYHSHPAGDARLSQEDVETHARLFPESWQVAFLFVNDPRAPAGACFRRTPEGFDGELRLPFYEMVTNESLLAKGVRRSRVDWENVSTLDTIRLEPPPRPEPPAGLAPLVSEAVPDLATDELPSEGASGSPEIVPVDEARPVADEVVGQVPDEVPLQEPAEPEPGTVDDGEPDLDEEAFDAFPFDEVVVVADSAVDPGPGEPDADEYFDDLDLDSLIAEVEGAGLSEADDAGAGDPEVEEPETEAPESAEQRAQPEAEAGESPGIPADARPEPESPESEPPSVGVFSEEFPSGVEVDPLVEIESELTSVAPTAPHREVPGSASVPEPGRKLRNRILVASGVVICIGVVGVLALVLFPDREQDPGEIIREVPAAVEVPSTDPAVTNTRDSIDAVEPPPAATPSVSSEELEELSNQVLASISSYYGSDGAYESGEIGCAELQSSFVEVMDSWIDYSMRGKAGWQGRLPPEIEARDERLYLGVQDVERLFEASSCPRP